MKNSFIKPIGVLVVICLVISSILVYVQGLTEPIITKQKIEAANAARSEVFPDDSSFEKMETELPEGGVEVYRASNGTGFVVTTKAKGYGGDLVVMVGIKTDGTISGVKNIENNETPGLGSKVKETPYVSQYTGKDSTLEGVEAIGGSTISSTAFRKAVDTAFEIFNTVKGAK